MPTILSKLLAELNSSVFVFLLVLIIVAYTLYKIGRFKEKFSHHEKQLNDAAKSYDLLVQLMTKVDLIYEFTKPRSLARSQSPTTLTPLGIEVSERIRANEMFSRHEASLSAEIAAKCSDNAHSYDTQVAAFKIAK